MISEASSRPDGTALAVAVRSLASDVKRLQGHGGAPAHEVAHLAGQIHHLRCSMQTMPTTPLTRWLENLERELYNL
jgi:hypothetical protein